MIESSDIRGIIEGISQNYANEELCISCVGRHFPSRGAIVGIIKEVRRLLFPRYFSDDMATLHRSDYYIGESLSRIEHQLAVQVREAFLFEDSILDQETLDQRVDNVVQTFLRRLPEVQRVLLTDIQAAFDGDPAAGSKEEIIFSYPGLFAIFVHRIAHELYVQNVPLIPRIMSEYAHDHSGVDINAGATIGEYFFIDHATGVVIGETTVIGKHVKVYQGVTLGALSTRAGQGLKGVKRHPTIEDNVTIYSNASVLGGETVVGAGSVIGGSAFVTSSVPKNARVSLKAEVNVRQSKPRDPQAFETV